MPDTNIPPRARRRLLGRSAAAIAVALAFAAGAPSVASADPTLKAAFGFDEAAGTQLPDVSGNGNNGTVAGATWTGAGRFGSALDFDGIDDIVSVPDADSLDFSVGMTLEAWVRPTQLTGYRVAIIKESGLQLVYSLYPQNGRYLAPSYPVQMEGRYRGPVGTSQLPVNTWSHIAGTYDGVVFRLYVNGVQVASEGRRGLVTTSNGSLRIGGTLIFPEYFKGQIDEVRLYNRGLTAAEVQADMNTAVAGQVDTNPPTAPTPFTETSHGATTVSTSWGASTDDRGVEGYHLFLNGNEVGTTTSTSFTFSGLSCSSTYVLGVEARDARPNASTRTMLSATTDDCDTTQPSVSLTAPAPAAQLAGTVSVTADASDNDAVAGVQFLLDGQALGAEDATAPYSVPWNTRSTTNGLHVLKARARDRSGNERTTDEITVTVENATAPPVDGLVAGYGFDEEAGTVALDSSNLGNTGTISGAERTPNGRIGRALDFDGVNDIVSAADSSSLDLTSGMTLSAWLRPDTLNGNWRTVIFKERPGGVVYSLYAQDRDPHPLAQMTVGTSTDARLGGTTQLPLATWTHLAVTYDGIQQRMWVDGQLVSSRAQTGTMAASTGALRVGANLIYGAERFDGLIDEVRVYNRALPQAEIQADMNTSVSEPDIDAPSAPAGLTATGSVGRVALNWQASTDNVGVTHYNVHRGTTPDFTPDATNRVAQPTTTAYTDSGLAAGTYHYKVTAADRVNNVSPPTAAASATVQSDTELPSVSITAPANGATVAGAINVTANAADNDAVVGVQFLLGGQPLGAEDTTAPYSVSWNTRQSPNGGPFVLTARARDGSANTRTSTAVSVQVENTFAPPPGLVAGYGFDEGTGTTVNDAAGNGNHGTILGATWVPVGRIGGALNFDGVDDWITIPDSNSLDLRTGMTLSAWVRPDAIGSAWRTVIFKERTGNLVYGNYANNGSGNVPNGEITTNGTIPPTVTGTSKVPDGNWTHLTVTYDGAALRLYMNGTLVRTVPRTGLIDASTGPLRIAGNSTWGERFDGLIDEVRVYDRPLSQEEVQTDMVTGVTGDSNPPTVSAFTPGAGETGVPVATSVTATFSEAMDASTINSTTFVLRDPAGVAVPATVTYDAGNAKTTLRSTSALQYGAVYTATLEGGSSGARVKDAAGNALVADYVRSFTTEPSPPPILVVDSQANPTSTYLAEIMRAEGLNGFSTNDVSLVDASYLANFDVVVLGDVAVTAAQVTALTNWVNAGGNLIALSPDKQLAALLGLTDSGTTLANAYLRVNTAAAPGTGLVNESIQFHGTADRYSLAGATAVATLYSNAGSPTSSPAVSLRSVGSNGGQAAAFTFDLATSTIQTRQGNPAWVGTERDGNNPIRTNDLFYGATEPNWVDLTKIHIPQADEVQRLFANVITFTNRDRTPVPRFWYLPRGEKAAVVMTGDDHDDGGTVGRFNHYKASGTPDCAANNGVEKWECVRSTSYVYAPSPITDAQAAQFESEGFEVALHPGEGGCGNFTRAEYEEIYSDRLAAFAASYPSVPTPTTSRFHCVSWTDWDSHALVENAHGIRLDTNYYHYPPSWGPYPGFMTGSGLLMKFADSQGRAIDTYQAHTHMDDEADQPYPATVNSLLDRAVGADGYYGLFTANMHTDDIHSDGSDAIVASAQARDVPVVSARQALRWVDGRNGSRFKEFTWSGGNLGFTVTAASGATGLEGMLPIQSSIGNLASITRDGTAVTPSVRTVKGIQYAVFPATDGRYAAHYGA